MDFTKREKPWSYEFSRNITRNISNATSAREAIEMAHLNWNVDNFPIFDVNGNEIEGFKANTRDVDNKVLGIVTNKYKIVQNVDAFDFTDSLIGEGIKYENAGSFRNGKSIWLLAKMPDRLILDDTFEPYICFTNSHDGSGSVRICMTPIRVACNNALNMAFRKASRSWATKHMGNIHAKLDEARHTLLLANNYMDTLAENADRLANSNFSNEDMEKTLELMFPITEDMSDRKKNNIESTKNEIIACMFAPDLIKFMNTKWGFINAVSDFVGHSVPSRVTETYRENNWNKIINGHPILDKAMALIA